RRTAARLAVRERLPRRTSDLTEHLARLRPDALRVTQVARIVPGERTVPRAFDGAVRRALLHARRDELAEVVHALRELLRRRAIGIAGFEELRELLHVRAAARAVHHDRSRDALALLFVPRGAQHPPR